MSDQIWVGTTSRFFLAAPPDFGVGVREDGFSDGFGFENGGQAEVRSSASSKVFDFAFSQQQASGLVNWKRLRDGSFGSEPVRFADPMAFETNLFSPHWAEPGLIEGDWPSIYDAVPTFANTAANSYDQPLRSAVFTITQAANTAPTKQSSRFIIPIPPDMTLRLGVSGAATGTGIVNVQAYNIAAGTSASAALTLLAPTSSTRLNASYAGSSYDYVAVDFRRTSSAASTLTIASMLAQLYTTGSSPTLTGNHRPGEGHTGLKMRGWETAYGIANTKTAKFSLVEVGAWLP